MDHERPQGAAAEPLPPRLITNGQNTADIGYLRALVRAGLRHMHVSVHSCRPAVQAALSSTPDSLDKIQRSLRHAGRLVSHRQLIAAGWGAQAGPESASLRLVVHQLRRKIEADPSDPRRLHTEVGIGYRLLEL